MYCTALRRRPSFASCVQFVSKTPLNLKESQLKTHDIEIPIQNDRTANKDAATDHVLRVLLLSTSDVSDAKMKTTIERIQHFGLLTGGEGLLIIFLLNCAPTTGFTSAKQLTKNDVNDTADQEAIVAYSKLQAETVNHADIPHIPIRPIMSIDEVSVTIKKHIDASKFRTMKANPSLTPFELLRFCTSNPPMSDQTAYVISDTFTDVKDLASACSALSTAPNSSSPSARSAAFQSGQVYDLDTCLSTYSVDSETAEKLKQLRDLVGEQECQDVMDFWKTEWLLH